jgi:hypothetical protein
MGLDTSKEIETATSRFLSEMACEILDLFVASIDDLVPE